MRFLIPTEVVYLQRWRDWCHMKLLPSQRILCTPYNQAPCHFMQSYIHKVHACLAVTCHLHFWQNDWDFLLATRGYWNKSQYRKLTLEKKILPPLLQGFEPTTFWSWVQRCKHWAIPAFRENRINVLAASRWRWLMIVIMQNALSIDPQC